MPSIQTTKTKDSRNNFVGKLLRMQESGIIIVTVLFICFITSVNRVFISPDNLTNILRSVGFTLITAVGMTLVLISGGLDLSVGSVMALGGVACGLAMKMGIPCWLAIILGAALGAIIGMINGYIIVKINIPPLIVTLGMQYMARGLVFILTEGVPVYPLPKMFQSIEQSQLLGIPTVVYIAFILAVIGHIILTRTAFGRAIYAVGGNVEAARISGIKTDKVRSLVYIITGALAALTGIMMASRLGSAQAGAGTGYELTVITAAIIGGTSTFGGIGTIFGTAVGALFVEILSNSMTLMRVSVYWQNLVIGAILVLAVVLDQYRRKIMVQKAIRQ